MTGVLIRTVRPSSSASMTGLISLVAQPCQSPVFLALAGSELTGWSMRRKSGTAPSTFEIATLLLIPMLLVRYGGHALRPIRLLGVAVTRAPPPATFRPLSPYTL